MIKKSKPNLLTAQASQVTQFESVRRRRVEYFRVLAGITELLRPSSDTNGCANGSLSTIDLAAHADVSRKAIKRALEHWRQWRVLWIYWKGNRVWEVRFQRSIVEGLLWAWKNSPREVGRMLIAHQRQRMELVPGRVPKTLILAPLQTTESIRPS
jgi:hypothetical protein